MTGIKGLAKVVHDHTGAEGPELEALTFFVAAGFADAMGQKAIGDYFDARCKEAWAQHKMPSQSGGPRAPRFHKGR